MRILKTLLVVLIITWGVLALAVRAITPFLADYREELSALASEHLGAPVVIGGLQARWYGLGPLLELRNVRVGEAPQTLEVERVELGLALTRLLHGSVLDALQVTFDGLQLMVVGEKRRFWIPADLAYGDQGRVAGPLTFDVELLEIVKGPEPPKTPENLVAPADALATESGLKSKVLRIAETWSSARMDGVWVLTEDDYVGLKSVTITRIEVNY